MRAGTGRFARVAVRITVGRRFMVYFASVRATDQADAPERHLRRVIASEHLRPANPTIGVMSPVSFCYHYFPAISTVTLKKLYPSSLSFGSSVQSASLNDTLP